MQWQLFLIMSPWLLFKCDIMHSTLKKIQCRLSTYMFYFDKKVKNLYKENRRGSEGSGMDLRESDTLCRCSDPRRSSHCADEKTGAQRAQPASPRATRW